jgi:hypothetical protein
MRVHVGGVWRKLSVTLMYAYVGLISRMQKIVAVGGGGRMGALILQCLPTTHVRHDCFWCMYCIY